MPALTRSRGFLEQAKSNPAEELLRLNDASEQGKSRLPAEENDPAHNGKAQRFIGIDAGAETIKLVELFSDRGGLRIGRREILEHRKQPGSVLVEALPTHGTLQGCGAQRSQRNVSASPGPDPCQRVPP